MRSKLRERTEIMELQRGCRLHAPRQSLKVSWTRKKLKDRRGEVGILSVPLTIQTWRLTNYSYTEKMKDNDWNDLSENLQDFKSILPPDFRNVDGINLTKVCRNMKHV